MTRQFFFLLYLLLISDTIAGILSGLKMWRVRQGKPVFKYLALMLACFVFWRVVQIIGGVYSPLHGLSLTSIYLLWNIGGMIPWSVSLWALTLYIYRVWDE